MVGGPVTVKTDVYALGVLLWQLVEGDFRRPIASGWEHSLDDALLIEDIALATAGDPARRLESVVELTVRLRTRHERQRQKQEKLDEKRREGQMAKSLERARARRPWLVTSMLALLLGLGASIYLYSAEHSAKRLIELDERRLESTNAFLTDILHSADPNAPGGAGATTLDTAINHARDLLTHRFSDDPATKGSLDLTLGDAFFGLSEYEKALEFHQEAVSLLKQSLGPQHTTTLTAEYKLAGTFDMLTRPKEAATVLDNADRNAGRLLREPSRLSFLAYSTHGGHDLLQMHASAALESFLITERIRAAIDPNNDEWLVHVRSDIAWCEVRLDRNAEATQMLSVLMTPRYDAKRIGMAEWMKLHLQYGIALSNIGRSSEAEHVLLEAEQEAERLLGPRYYLVGLAFNYLAAHYRNMGNWPAATRAANREIEIFVDYDAAHQARLGSMLDGAVIDYLRAPDDVTYRNLKQAQETVSHALGARSGIAQYANYYLAVARLDHGQTDGVAELIDTLDSSNLASADISPDWPSRIEGLRGRFLLASNNKAQGARLIRTAVATLKAHGDQPWMIEPLEQALRDAQAI